MKDTLLSLSIILFAISLPLQAATLRRANPSRDIVLDPYKSQTYKVSLQRVDAPPERRMEFISILSKTHEKMRRQKNQPMVLLEKSSVEMSSMHEIKLTTFQNSQYIGDLSIGNNMNSFKVIFDTGSANIWINSVKCSDAGCRNHKQYNPNDSSTYKNLGFDLDVEFGTGELIGQINADKVFLAGVEISDQKLAEITQEIGDVFVQSGFDGIVGLGYPSMAAYNMEPIFDNLMKQGRLDRNVFSFYFDTQSQNSHFVVGGADETYYEPPLKFFPVTDKYYWTLQASKILVNGRDVGLCQGGCKLVADTGTSLLTGPYDDLNILLEHVGADSSCNFESLPDITFVLSNGSQDPYSGFGSENGHFTLAPNDYLLRNSDFGGGPGCAPGFMALDVPEPHGPVWILGDIFLKKFYSVYDRDNDVVGFALAKSNNEY